jgi:hypothetical protein
VNPDQARRLTVYVDGEPRSFFLGLRVRHAIGYGDAWLVEQGKATVLDGEGNFVDLDGALYDGERLYVKQVPEDASSATGGTVSLD